MKSIIVAAISMLLIIFSCLIVHTDAFWQIIASQLEAERQKEVGEYTVVDWNDGLFQINHYMAKDCLQMMNEDFTVVLLEDVSNYKSTMNNLYIVSSYGYAIIDKENNVQILITRYDELDKNSLQYEFKSNITGRRMIFSKKYDDKHITYFESFDQFSEKAQKYLKELDVSK